LKNDLYKKKSDQSEIINRILNTNESISKELEIFKEKYDYMKEKNLILKKELNGVKSVEKEDFGETKSNEIIEKINPNFKAQTKKLHIETYSSRKTNSNDFKQMNLNVSPLIHNQNSNNTLDSQFLDTTTKKLFSQFVPDKGNTFKQMLNYDYQTSPQEENFFIESLIKETAKSNDLNLSNGEWANLCKSARNNYKNELLVLQNKFKDRFKEQCLNAFPGKNFDFLGKASEEIKKIERLEDNEFVIKLIENCTVFNNVDFVYNFNPHENYEQNAKALKKIFDEKVELIDKSMENYKTHLETYFRKKIQITKSSEMKSNENARIPIVSITNEHNENLKKLRGLYEEKLEQLEKRFFEVLKRITKETDN
jgi:hypothetical protein